MDAHRCPAVSGLGGQRLLPSPDRADFVHAGDQGDWPVAKSRSFLWLDRDSSVNRDLPSTPKNDVAAASGRRWRTWGRRVLSLLVVLTLVYFLRNTLLGAWEQLHQLQADTNARLDFRWGWCFGAAAIYVVGVLPAGWFWHRVLRDLGQKTSLARAMRAYIIGHLGKYVPGKLWVVFLRVGLVAGPEVQPSMAAAAVFIETLTMMAVGAFLSAVYLVFAWQGHGQLLAAAVGTATVAVFFTLPPVFKPVLRIIARKSGREDVLRAVECLGFRTLWQGWLGMGLLWICFGISLWMTLRALGLGVPFWPSLPRMVAAAALATVSGFVIILLPGGLGVREFVLVALLAPYLSNSLAAIVPAGRADLTAVLAAGLLRVVWVMAEMAAALVAWFSVWPAIRSSHPSRSGNRSPSPATFEDDAVHRVLPADLP